MNDNQELKDLGLNEKTIINLKERLEEEVEIE